MELTREQMLAGMYRRDRSLNGRYVVAVTSTRIFCLPDCPARKPKADHVLFFLDPQHAAAAGYRACKRCRPDAYYRGEDPDLSAIEMLVAQVRREPQLFADGTAMAARSGYGLTKLTALLRRHFHCSPASLLQAARIGRAQSLLAGGSSPIEAALACGYESSSAFYRNFVRQTGLTPGEYRSLGSSPVFALRLPGDYSVEHSLKLLGRDPESPTERRDGDRLSRALLLDRYALRLDIEFSNGWARCSVSCDRAMPADVLQALHRTLCEILGFGCEPEPFVHHVERLPRGLELIRGCRNLRLLRFPSLFETLSWAIIGQQVNLAFAYRLRGRLIELCGRPAPGGLRVHPPAGAVAELDYADLTRRQFSRRKAEYLIDLARSIAARALQLDSLHQLSATRGRQLLLETRGIGPWTADYVLMRGAGFADCLPVGDAGLVQALRDFHGLAQRPDAETTSELMAPYAPFRSFATSHFWARLTQPN